jgi:RHS repeat-associated protein
MKSRIITEALSLLASRLRLVGIVGTMASVSFAGTHRDTYYVNDHLATTVATADAAGKIAQIEADAFGTPVSGGAQAARYTGKPYDADLGAYVFPYRNYRPEEARWASADPSGFPDGVNSGFYSPNPFSEVDAFGLKRVYGDILLTNNPYTKKFTQAESLTLTSYTVTNTTTNTIQASYTGQISVGTSGINATINASSGYSDASGYSYSYTTSWINNGVLQEGFAQGRTEANELAFPTSPNAPNTGETWIFDSWIIIPAVYDTSIGAPSLANITVNSRDRVQTKTYKWQAKSKWYYDTE